MDEAFPVGALPFGTFRGAEAAHELGILDVHHFDQRLGLAQVKESEVRLLKAHQTDLDEDAGHDLQRGRLERDIKPRSVVETSLDECCYLFPDTRHALEEVDSCQVYGDSGEYIQERNGLIVGVHALDAGVNIGFGDYRTHRIDVGEVFRKKFQEE